MDLLLVSPSLSPHLRAAGVDVETRGWEKPSDHAPAWIEIDELTDPDVQFSRIRAAKIEPWALMLYGSCGCRISGPTLPDVQPASTTGQAKHFQVV